MSAWPLARIEQCAEIVSGATPSTSESEYWDGDIHWATPRDLSALEGAYLSGTPRKITKRGLESCAATILPPNSVLFSSRAPIGHVAINTVPMATNQGFKSFVPRPDRLDPKFLYHWLRKNRAHLESLGNGATFKEVSKAVVSRIEIPLPPLSEQRRIAEILDKADALRAKRRAALAQLDTLTQSIFLDMFGDPATNPMGWPKASLEELFEIARGGSPRPIDDYITDDPDGINWIMIGDTVEGGKYITSTRKRIRPEGARRSRAVKPGDFLLTNSMSFGRPYIMRTFGCIHDGWLVLSPRREDVEPNYFFALLGTQAVYAEFARRAPGATVKNLNIDLVRGVTVPVPPLPTQRKYAEIVASIERRASTYNRALAECDTLFSALQHRAFRGEL